MATIALIAGHNHFTGARSLTGDDEWTYNNKVIGHLKPLLKALGHRVIILVRDRTLGYTSAMRKLARQMKAVGADLTIELHFNSSDYHRSNGFEFLHWWRSKASRLLAQCLGRQFTKNFPDIKQRGTDSGARTLWFHRWNADKAYSRNGGAFCFLTPCPAVICEPGFASNSRDWVILEHSQKELAQAYADGIELYLQTVN